MFDAKRITVSRLVAIMAAAAFLLTSFPIFSYSSAHPRRGDVSSSPSGTRPANTNGHRPSLTFTPQSGATYDKVVQDDSNGDLIRFNSTTGDYLFSKCSTGFTLSGTGSVTRHGSQYTLSHNAVDRRVSASLDTSTRRGSGSVQYPVGTTIGTITDRDITNDPSASDTEVPVLSVGAPNGGELVDIGSMFAISWSSSDNSGVASHDVLLSTNAGTSFSPIVTGLPGTVNQYAWLVPVMANNRNARIRVLARDSACNVVQATSAANFTIWNPPASFTHSAEAPAYTTGGSFDAYVYMCNSTANSIIVELDLHRPDGEATANDPPQITLAPNDVRKLRVGDYLNLGGSTGTVQGSIRLRHNGQNDSDVQAMLVTTRFDEDQSFTSPFVYPTTSQSPDGTVQRSPLYYIDDLTTAVLSVQNAKDYPVDVNVTLRYGTGEPGTPNGTYVLPPIKLAAQGHMTTNLAQFKDEMGGAEWGSISISAPPQTIAAHTVMKSPSNGFAFTSAFIDAKKSVNTTKVATGLKLDYDAGVRPCVMVCNASTTDTRMVTANFQSDTGVNIPTQQVTLLPGEQRMLELDATAILSPHQSTMADVRLTYSGNGSDIIAGAVSMSAAGDSVIGARLVEPSAGDGQQLMSPFFKVDARTPGMVQISNLGSTNIRAGVRMKFANSTAPPVTTDLVNVAAGRTSTLNIQPYIEQASDGLTAEGCIELVHNGAPGTVSCSFVSMTPDPIETPLQPTPPMCQLTTFPSDIDLQPGDTVQVYVLTCGGGAVTWTAGTGTITPQPSPDPGVETAIYSLPDDDGEPDTAIIQVASPGGAGTIGVEIQKAKLKGIATFDPMSNDTGGRLNPAGDTEFRLTAAKDFPAVPLRVIFQQGSQRAPVDIPSDSAHRPDARTLVGIAPPQDSFIGDVQVRVVTADVAETKISKKTLCDEGGCSAYYSANPPSPATAVTPDGYNRLGGILTITGSGYRVFRDRTPNVDLDGIDFAVNFVNQAQTQINGLVLRAPANVVSCAVQGQTPCKIVSVKNPAGRHKDRVPSNIPLYNLKPGPAPQITEVPVPLGRSTGGEQRIMKGLNLDFVTKITINLRNAPILSQTNTQIVVTTPPGCKGAATITLLDADAEQINVAGFQYLATRPTFVTAAGLGEVFIVGGCTESVELAPGGVESSPPCIQNVAVRFVEVQLPNDALPFLALGVRAFRTVIDFTHASCAPDAHFATFSFAVRNTADTTLVGDRVTFTRGF
jgi:hypothetical protein